MSIIDDYNTALDKIYEHVGFVEDWVVYPILDETDRYWYIMNSDCFKMADTEKDLDTTDNCYLIDIYTQRFYEKHIYRGEDYTMIFGTQNVDGMKWFYILDNKKEIKHGE
jgi:hypothetical protein